MKALVVFILILVSHQALGQNYRFYYHVKYVEDTIKNLGKQETYYLETGKTDRVVFFNAYLYEYDSLARAEHRTRMLSLRNNFTVVHKKGSWDNMSYQFVWQDYYKINSHDSLHWTILPDTKREKDWNLQKATARFGGRHWTAWFCPEIPIQEGPYKFRGLPGLIFDIYDDQNYFRFELSKISKLKTLTPTSNFLEVSFGRKALLVTPEKYNQQLLNNYYNPYASTRRSLEKPGSMLAWHGNAIRTTQQFDAIKKDIQQVIKTHYNPIERDKAVKFK